MEVLFRSYELETANIIIGNYIKEDGFYMENGEPIYGKPCTRHYIQDEDCIKHEIAEDYLSINLKDMLDSQGNKIFASLSEDGKGGDIMKDDEYYGIAKYADSRLVVEYENVEECLCEGNFEVVGIQK